MLSISSQKNPQDAVVIFIVTNVSYVAFSVKLGETDKKYRTLLTVGRIDCYKCAVRGVLHMNSLGLACLYPIYQRAGLTSTFIIK